MAFSSAVRELRDVLTVLNGEIVSRFGPMEVGSTLVLLFLCDGYYAYMSSGDSRIYRARGFSPLQQLTVDDVYENYLVRGERQEPSLNGKLVAAVGLREPLRVTVHTDRLRRGDRFFLCSDGVYRFVSWGQLVAKVTGWGAEPNRVVTDLAQEVEKNGARDNYTMIYVRVKTV